MLLKQKESVINVRAMCKKKKKKGGKRERQTCLITMFVDSHNEEIFGLCRRCERIQETRTDQELEFCITSSTLEN